jgi:site-specific DNA-methyltransferase (adenine-specific)
MKEWPDEFIDLVVTSPPYDNLRTYGGHEWDFEGVAEQLTRCLKPGGVIVWVVADATVNGSETLTSMRQAIHFKDVCGLNVWDTMIWDKGKCSVPTESRYYDCIEYMFVFSKGKPKALNFIEDRVNVTAGGRRTSAKTKIGRENRSLDPSKSYTVKETGRRYNLWKVNPFNETSYGHPAIFPEKLAFGHVATWSNPGDIVLDPFAGSGTTLKAAKELNRRYIGIEINPEYVEICNNRTAQEVLPLCTA